MALNEGHMTPDEIKKLKRQIIDYLHKYATVSQLKTIAKVLWSNDQNK